MTTWNRLEQFFKKSVFRWLERLIARPVVDPATLDARAMQRVLVIRQHDMLGDFLLATPVLRALRQHRPDRHISVLAREYFSDIAAANPDADTVYTVFKDARRWRPGTLWRLVLHLRSGWDLVVVLNTVSHSLTSDLLSRLARASCVIGSADRPFPGTSRNFLYNIEVARRPEKTHQSQRNLDILSPLCISTDDLSEYIAVAPERLTEARRTLSAAGLQSGKPVIGMHVGAGKPPNRWPASSFASLAARLQQEGFEIVLFHGPAEAELAQSFLAHAKGKVVTAPQAALLDVAAMFATCDALVCNDTGVMHVAAAAGARVVAVFGPTDPDCWKPAGERCVAVRGADGTTESVDVESVYSQLVDLLRSAPESSPHSIGREL